MKEKKISLITRFFCISAGAYIPLLNKFPSQITKYYAMGVILWITAIMACLSGGYFLSSIFNSGNTSESSLYLGIPFGVFWGLAIFSLDRYMVISIQPGLSLKKKIVQALPRFLLAICLAMVVSKPLELRFFKKEIDNKVAQLNQIEYKQVLESDKTLDIVNNEIKSLEKMISEIDTTIIYRKNILEKLKIDYYNEYNGVSGGISTGVKGDGPKAKEKYRLWISTKKEDSLNQINSTDERKKLNRKIDTLKKELRGIEDQIKKPVDNNNGPLIQIEALHSIIGEKLPLKMADLILSLIFILFEVAPVIVKLSMKKGLYEYALEDYEEEKKNNLIEEIKSKRYKIKLYHKGERAKLNRSVIREQNIENEKLNKDLNIIKRQSEIDDKSIQDDNFVIDRYKKIESYVLSSK